MQNQQIINADTVRQRLPFRDLVAALAEGFQQTITVPMRSHFDVANPAAARETTLLMMPAWQDGQHIGVKLVTVAPDNGQKQLPTIQGCYLLFNVDDGALLAMMDAPALTARRTAAASALASSLLSNENTSTLLMVGTGTLAPELIAAHCAVRPIERVLIWGRNQEKAKQVKTQVSDLAVKTVVVSDLASAVAEADIISCATMSVEPLIKGQWLKPGQHLDMVGAYRPDMREMDDNCLTKARVFVDNTSSAIKETGDLAIPLAQGVINLDAIEADLFRLIQPGYRINRQASDITIFKSVGHAIEDFVAARMVMQGQV